MFGAVAWMVNGNVACGVMGDDLLVRVDIGDRDRLVAEAHVHPVTTGRRTMRGFVAVDPDSIAGEGELARWLDAAAGYAAWLPPK
jgi:TfoX/Sxy family transcriptional regulator of competence genes